MNAADTPLTVAWFASAFSGGPAYGEQERTTWGELASIYELRREGFKDGPGFIPSRFAVEPNGKVRRLLANAEARTLIALDIETSKKTGEVPPPPDVAIDRVRSAGLAAVIYTSHSHKAGDTRYRAVMPLSAEIAPNLPAPEVVSDWFGLLGVLDTSKVNAAGFFYLPSCPPGALEGHRTAILSGRSIDAARLTQAAGALLEAREAEAERLAAEARAEAARRREAKLAAGFNPDDGLIEKLRPHFDLDAVLAAHGYVKRGRKYKHPNSSSGCYGADIKELRGIERVYSHNGTDPLHRDNLPSWCTVAAVDVIDVVTILEFGGDRTRALRTLGDRFGLTKAAERKALAALLFGLIKSQAKQEEIEAAAFAEGERLGLSRDEVYRVIAWVRNQPANENSAGAAESRKSIARAAFRLLRLNVPSHELLATLHRLNARMAAPLSQSAVEATALWAARESTGRIHA